MASLRFENDRGRQGWRLQFYVAKKRETIWLSDADDTTALLWKKNVEQLVACLKHSDAPHPSVIAWLKTLSKKYRERLVQVGLIAPQEPTKIEKPLTLGEYLASYFEARESEAKRSTVVFWGHTRKRLVEYFGADRALNSITAVDAREFRKWLEASNKREKGEKKKPLAQNTLRRRTGLCRQIFGQAVDDGLIVRNPFKGMAAAVKGNKERQFYVDRETFAKVLEKAPNARWRALLVLARIAAVRVPSEIQGLCWSHIAWDAKRITILSPKTEHHEGHESRVIPLFDEVEKELLKLYAEAEAGDQVFPTVKGDSNLRTTLQKIIARAGVQQWPKLWQNLRASGATDLARSLPAHVASAICGHTVEVAREHYWQVTETDFDNATKAVAQLGFSTGGATAGQPDATPGDSKEGGDEENAEKTCVYVASSCSELPLNGRGGTRTPDIYFVRVAL